LGFAICLFATVESRFQAFLGQAAANLLDGERTDVDHLTYLGIQKSAIFAVNVAEEQDFGTFAFALGTFIGASDNLDLLALFFAKRDIILSGGHGGCSFP
jgi:hypothetical protein